MQTRYVNRCRLAIGCYTILCVTGIWLFVYLFSSQRLSRLMATQSKTWRTHPIQPQSTIQLTAPWQTSTGFHCSRSSVNRVARFWLDVATFTSPEMCYTIATLIVRIVIENKHCNLSGGSDTHTPYNNKQNGSHYDLRDRRRRSQMSSSAATLCVYIFMWGKRTRTWSRVCVRTPQWWEKKARFPTNAAVLCAVAVCNSWNARATIAMQFVVSVCLSCMEYIKTDLYCTIIMIDMLLT